MFEASHGGHFLTFVQVSCLSLKLLCVYVDTVYYEINPKSNYPTWCLTIHIIVGKVVELNVGSESVA